MTLPGLHDGDGNLCFHTVVTQQTPNQRLHTSIAQSKSKALLLAIRDHFGSGQVYGEAIEWVGGKDLQGVLPMLLAHSQIKHQKLVCVLYGLAGVPLSRSVKFLLSPHQCVIKCTCHSSQCANACVDLCMQPALVTQWQHAWQRRLVNLHFTPPRVCVT